MPRDPVSDVTPRAHLVGTGLFVSVPQAFPGIESQLAHLLKVNLALQSTRKAPTATTTAVLSDRVLFDIASLKGAIPNIEQIEADCKLVASVARRNPKKIQDLFNYSAAGDFKRAAKLADQLGLTEAAAKTSGGGLLWLVALVVIAVAASGCNGCAHNPKSGGKLPDYNGKDGGK